MRRHRTGPAVAALLIVGTVLAGCGRTTGQAPPGSAVVGSASSSTGVVDAAAVGFNDTDVMFLQMSLEHIRQGDQVVELAERRATTAAVRDLAAAMDTEWAAEAGTMTRWLTGWNRPLAVDPASSVHAGHGDLHSLRPGDIEELRTVPAVDFDRTAMTMLIGHLHNSVEVARLEVAGGSYPPARDLAETMTTTRMAQIQTMLGLVA
jgi:uncharacterized protein (DUF305 family)